MRPNYKRKLYEDTFNDRMKRIRREEMQDAVYRALPRGGVPAVNRPAQRAGYGSTARARGAAVTGEMKYFDCERDSGAISAVTTTWVAGCMVDPTRTINLGDASVATPLCLFAPKVSAALNGRIGRKAHVYKVRIAGTIKIPPQTAQGTADASPTIRLALVLDKQSNAAQMTAATLFNDAAGAETTITAFQNPNNFGRFRVLKEKYYQFSNVNLTGDPSASNLVQCGCTINFKMSVSFKQPVQVNFNATNGGTVADIIDNSLHIVCGATSVAMAPVIAYYSRVCYKE